MKQLESTFNDNGYRHRIIKRTEWVVMTEFFEKDDEEFKQRKGIEVFRVFKKEAGKVMGKDYGARETPPNNARWGTYGLSYNADEKGRQQADLAYDDYVSKWPDGWSAAKKTKKKKNDSED